MIKNSGDLSRCQKIYDHPLYQKHFESLQELEKDRIFCRHTFEHFMDVARIAYIMNLEQELGLSKEIIYAAALLHDIGRDEQYINGTPHEVASAKIAEEILGGCGFSDDEIRMIVGAIKSHRGSKENSNEENCPGTREESSESVFNLSRIIYTADKASRQCFSCKAQEECNWSMDKRNLEISI
jgi:uncharacterized protein